MFNFKKSLFVLLLFSFSLFSSSYNKKLLLEKYNKTNQQEKLVKECIDQLMKDQNKEQVKVSLNQYVSSECPVIGCEYTSRALGVEKTSSLLRHLHKVHAIKGDIKAECLMKCPLNCRQNHKEKKQTEKRMKRAFYQHLSSRENDDKHKNMIAEQQKTQTQLLRDFLEQQGLQLK